MNEKSRTSFGAEDAFDFLRETTVFAIGNVHGSSQTSQLIDIITRAVARPLVVFHDRATNPRNNGMVFFQMSDEAFVIKAMERLQGYEYFGLKWCLLSMTDSSLLRVKGLSLLEAVSNLKKMTKAVLVVDACVIDGPLWVLKAKYWAVFLSQHRTFRDASKIMKDLEKFDREVIKSITLKSYQSHWRETSGEGGEESFLRISRAVNGTPYIGVKDAECWAFRMFFFFCILCGFDFVVCQVANIFSPLMFREESRIVL